MDDVGVIGVGVIGKQVVDALRSGGYAITAHDTSADAMRYAADRGAETAPSPAGVVDAADVVVLSLPGSDAVESVMTGEEGVLSAIDADQLVIDTSTVAPSAAERWERRCGARGAGFLSAPLTRAAAEEGLHLMVGGRPDHYERSQPILDCIGAAHVRVGGIRAGLVLKLMVQLRLAGRAAVDAETVEFGRANGVDPALLVSFLGLDVSEKLLREDYRATQEGMPTVAQWEKDLGYALGVAAETGIATPLADRVHDAFEFAVDHVEPPDGDQAAVALYWRSLDGRE